MFAFLLLLGLAAMLSLSLASSETAPLSGYFSTLRQNFNHPLLDKVTDFVFGDSGNNLVFDSASIGLAIHSAMEHCSLMFDDLYKWFMVRLNWTGGWTVYFCQEVVDVQSQRFHDTVEMLEYHMELQKRFHGFGSVVHNLCTSFEQSFFFQVLNRIGWVAQLVLTIIHHLLRLYLYGTGFIRAASVALSIDAASTEIIIWVIHFFTIMFLLHVLRSMLRAVSLVLASIKLVGRLLLLAIVKPFLLFGRLFTA